MKPLCDENCLGLCPTCGVNRTRERCSCETSIGDERWGALKDSRAHLSKKRNVKSGFTMPIRNAATRGERAAPRADFLKLKSLSTCPQCHEAKEPHRVCAKCGYYKGREVVAKDVL
jgi:large subunit ribosomal protein L32